MRRRDWLAMSTAALAAGCNRRPEAIGFSAQWIGASQERGHRLRELRSGALPTPTVQRRTGVLIVGAGIAGLAAARALRQAGVDDFALLELEDSAGGNSRGHAMAGIGCPLGAHYLPVPGPAAHEVSAWLHEIGLLRSDAQGRSLPDERALCHSPQERLFFEGAWHDGLLPPAEDSAQTLRQYRAFGARVDALERELGFAIPTAQARWTPAHDALDALSFETWLAREGLADARLRWYLDYACRDDYGAGLATVSAWAGIHYFASRHGFHAPGDDSAERDGVFTWPEGNAWLMRQLAAPLGDRLHAGRTVLRIAPRRHDVQALAWDAAGGAIEGWSARAVVVALPLFVAARLFDAPPPALAEAAASGAMAPWLVANLQLTQPLLDRRIGAPPSWDNVRYGSASLGYVDATHQRLDPRPGPTVLTAYWALPVAQRGALLADSAQAWADRVVADLLPQHPDLPSLLTRVDLMRYGHAMSIPLPGRRGSAALAALASAAGRVQFAHADLSAYSVFEEAFGHGLRAGRSAVAALRSP